MHPLNNSHPVNWDVYFTRFMVMGWLLIFPCIFFCSFWFLKELNKGSKIVVISSTLKPFYAYKYFFHNLIFSFLFISMIFNTLLLIYSIFDTYILNLNLVYKNLWDTTNKQSPNGEYKFLWNVIFLGYLFHTISFLTYSYHNLYYTDSYFGERWRWFISINTSNRKLLAFKQRHPKIWDFIYPKFLNVESISLRFRKRKLITLD